MAQVTEMQPTNSNFVERRTGERGNNPAGYNRRQFADSYGGLSPEARQLAEAIDAYKAEHHRKFINFEEMLQVIHSLGYHL